MDVPTLRINRSELQNILGFIYKHKQILEEFGAFKIQLHTDCILALKKRRKNLVLSPTMKQIIKIHDDQPLYSVEKLDYINQSIEKTSSIINENHFWSSLSCSNNKQQLNISFLRNKSFFTQKLSTLFFSIHRVPYQSLLKLGGSQLTKQFVPCIRRAHGPGAIFPMNCNEHNLFSIDYHHEGGEHHWYIIPHHQREILQYVINQQKLFSCLDHGKIFIDPSILDKNKIIYYRIIQQPNEFVVLSAGTLAQSFTKDASWNESISFALPSWIEQGYATMSTKLCLYNCLHNSRPQTIDLTLFRHERIQKYIHTNLNIISNDQSADFIDDNDININTIPTPNSNIMNSANDEIIIPKNVKVLIPRLSIVSNLLLPSTPLLLSNMSSYNSDDDKNQSEENNVQAEEGLLSESDFWDTFDWDTPSSTLIDTISNEDLTEQIMSLSQLYGTTTTSIDTHQNIINNCNDMELEELLNTITSTQDSIVSKCQQIDENLHRNDSSTISLSTDKKPRNKQSHLKKQRKLNRRNYTYKTLFVSGLRSNIKKSDITSHFIGCMSVTIKPYRSTPYLKYAFVYHRTSRRAACNLQRPINYRLLGPECSIEYATGSSTFLNNQPNYGKRKLAVRQIPENVSENDLCRLFDGCQILKYCPACVVHRSNMATKINNNNKILPGYAFILYNNEEQAINVIKNANQYQINNRTLDISVYRGKTFSDTSITKNIY